MVCKMKEISIIVPCYNVEKYIDRCVQSLVDQTLGLDKMECILVDDASTDRTLEKLKEWEQRYPESILVIHCEENRKQGAARNLGLQYAGGEYIGFVDSDDYVSLEMYDELLDKAKKYDCDVVSCLAVREEQNGRVAIPAELRKDAEQRICIGSVEERRKFLQIGLPGYLPSKIIRKKVITDNQILFPEELLYEDNYFGALLNYIIGSYYIINQPFYHYMINEQSTVMQREATHHLDRLVIELMKIEEYQRRGLLEIYHDEIEFDFLRMYFINTIRILFVRFQQIPSDIIYSMQENVKELFPNYQNNPYLEQLPQLQAELLKIVEVSLDQEKINILAEAYQRVLQEHGM